jgi:nucleoside-diphosphate-sugar epimerase
LAKAFIQVLGNEKASQQVFNISGEKYVTFDGLAKACAKVILDYALLTIY